MKPTTLLLILVSVLGFFYTNAVKAQKTKEKNPGIKAAERSALISAVEHRKFLFTEQMFTTGQINFQHLAPFTFLMDNDFLTTDFPDFSNSFFPESFALQGQLPLKTKAFSYHLKTGKKDGWDIRIASLNQLSTARISMHISSIGYATVSVSSQYGGPTSYYGTVAPIEIIETSAFVKE